MRLSHALSSWRYWQLQGEKELVERERERRSASEEAAELWNIYGDLMAEAEKVGKKAKRMDEQAAELQTQREAHEMALEASLRLKS